VFLVDLRDRDGDGYADKDLLVNDNNFPAGGGRAPDRPDENELILIRLDRALDVARGL
jgi:hypothetical protein